MTSEYQNCFQKVVNYGLIFVCPCCHRKLFEQSVKVLDEDFTPTCLRWLYMMRVPTMVPTINQMWNFGMKWKCTKILMMKVIITSVVAARITCYMKDFLQTLTKINYRTDSNTRLFSNSSLFHIVAYFWLVNLEQTPILELSPRHLNGIGYYLRIA